MRRFALTLFVTLALVGGGPAPALASCLAPPFGPGGSPDLGAQLAAAPVVFVGTVISTKNNDRVAAVRVESVWKGSGIHSVVTVVGTPDQQSAATSVDRTFTAGGRYLFVPSSPGSPFSDSNCSATRLYTRELDTLRPLTALPPLAGGDAPEPMGLGDVPAGTWVSVLGAGLVVLVIGVVLFLRHRRRATPPPAG